MTIASRVVCVRRLGRNVLGMGRRDSSYLSKRLFFVSPTLVIYLLFREVGLLLILIGLDVPRE